MAPVYGTFVRDGFLFSYDVRVRPLDTLWAEVIGSVRPIIRLAPGASSESVHSGAAVILGGAIARTYGLPPTHVTYEETADFNLAARVHVPRVYTLCSQDAALRKQLPADALETCVAHLADRVPPS